jgi:alanine-glyoxylate transaminase / serine-glyoxylate transaminase / serine-pyruvate transaminase
VSYQPGRHFLQLPGPTNSPLAVLQALALPTIDHRGPEFGQLVRGLLSDIKAIFKTTEPVIIYTASGTGTWEAALVNTLSPGDRVLMPRAAACAIGGWRSSAAWSSNALRC